MFEQGGQSSSYCSCLFQVSSCASQDILAGWRLNMSEVDVFGLRFTWLVVEALDPNRDGVLTGPEVEPRS